MVPGRRVSGGSLDIVGNSALDSPRLECLMDAERCIWTFDGWLGILMGAGAGFRDRGGVVALSDDAGGIRVSILMISVKQKITYIMSRLIWRGIVLNWQRGKGWAVSPFEGRLLWS